MKRELFEELVGSIRRAGRIRGDEAAPSREFTFLAQDVRAVRAKLAKSRAELARMIGVRVATPQNWEQGRREPQGPARALRLIGRR